MADRKLIVEIIGDDSSLQRTFKNSSVGARKFGKDMDSVAGKSEKLNQALRGSLSVTGGKGGFLFGSGTFIGSAIATAAIAKSIQAASDLNEQVSKNRQVFGESAKQIEAWSETTSRSIGISEEKALEATGIFGNLFKAIGIGQQESAETSKRLVQLAADLASFNNADPTQVLEDIRSGLVGEAEPLRKYGILLSESRVQQLALAQTGKTSVKALTDQEKALARVNIIFKDSKAAQGDFARTSNGLANQQRILSAEVADLEANLGKLLLPAVVKLTHVFVEATGAAVTFVDKLQALGKVQIPTIHIPFAFDIPGGSLFGRIEDIAVGFEKNLPINRVALEIGERIADQFDTELQGQTPELASQFRASLGGFFQDALDQAVQNIPTPKTTKTPGFATGLKPEDILGPLLTDIPKKLQEALLDAQIAGDPKAIVATLEKQRKAVLDELDDPRLTRDQRIALKEKLKQITDAIDAENAQIAQAAKTAADKRAQAAADQIKQAQDAQRKQAEAAAKARERQQKAIQAAQFKALGLTAEGEKPTPGTENLKKQLAQITERLGPDVAPKIKTQLARIEKVLTDPIHKATLETRKAIVDMFETIRGTFDRESKGPLTKTTALSSNKIIDALGLKGDLAKRLREQLSGFNSAGLALAGAANSTNGFARVVPVNQTTVVHTSVDLDGKTVARNTTRHQQKRSRRNPPQKRGI